MTVTEQNQEYISTFKLDDGPSQTVNTLTFSITDDATLDVVNTLGIVVPTGVIICIVLPLVGALIVLACILFVMWRKKHFPT